MADNLSEQDRTPGSASTGLPAGSSAQQVPQRLTYLVTAGAVIIIVILLIVLAGGESSSNSKTLSEAQVRQIVQEAVGTEIAAMPVTGGSVNAAQMQNMIDTAVSTKVAGLVPTATSIPPTPTVIPREVAEGGDPYRGPKDAPIVIIEFADFQCGYCARWYQETLPQILEKYPQQVKFVYRDFTIFGDDSVRAAEAAKCANDQGKFWEYHNRLFDHTLNQEQTALSQDTLVGYAKDLGLDTRSFGDCLSSQKYASEIQADYQTAVDYGLRGTPGFVIDGVVYTIGAQPFNVFDQIIQSELSKSASAEG